MNSNSHFKNTDKITVNSDVMNKFGFLPGVWNLEYLIQLQKEDMNLYLQ